MKNILTCIFSFFVLSYSHAQDVYALIAQAEENLQKNHWEQAVKNFKNIIAKYEDDLTYQQRAKIYNHLGYLYYNLLDPFEAENYLNLAIVYHEEAGIPNPKDYSQALLNLGVLYLDQAEFDLARQYIEKSLEILETIPGDKSDYWIARSKLGFVFEEAGAYTTALSIYDRSFNELVASGNDLTPDFAEICMHKGRILIYTGDPLEGEKFIALSNTIYESLGSTYAVQQAESLEHLAVFYEKMGRFEQAEATLLKVLELKRSIPDEADILVIETLNDLGILYQQLGQYDRAKEMFHEVVKECEENVGTDHPFYATAMNNLGTIAINEGNLDGAREMFKAALKTYKEKFGENHPYYANTLNNLARVERKLGNTYEAEQYYLQVLEIDRRVYGREHPNYATTLMNLGILCSTGGREDEAVKYYEEALEVRGKVLGVKHHAYGNVLEYLGMHALATNDFISAEKYFSEAINIEIERIHTLIPIMNELEREAFYNNIAADIDRYNYIAFRLLNQKPELIKNIYDFHVKTKSILFSTSDEVHELIEKSDDFELKELYRQWQTDKRHLASYYQMGLYELENLNVNLDYEEARIERLEDRITERIENFEGMLQRVREDWKKVQASIRPDEAVLEVVKIRSFESLEGAKGTLFSFTDFARYLAIIFLPDQTEPTFAQIGKDKTTDDYYWNLYEQYLKGEDRTEAFNLLWKPIHEKVKNAKKVRMGTDGIFHGINPNVFQLPEQDFVLDRYHVSKLSSPKDLFQKKHSIHTKRAYLFSRPLLTADEAGDPAALSSLPDPPALSSRVFDQTDWQVRAYTQSDANEVRLKSAFHPTVLHFDAYAFYEDKFNYIQNHTVLSSSLFLSGIYLSGASESYARYLQGVRTIQENDGILSTHEIMNLELTKTELVVISDIASPVSIENVEALYGLERAFIVAGARNMITKIIDEKENSYELFELFYKRYNETGAVGDSFWQAQVALRKKYPDPRIWGSYMITGVD